MPQTTASDKIASKEYLLPNFDANKLKMAELRNVLNLHGVDYSSCRTKPQLVLLFDAEVRTQHGPSPVARRHTRSRLPTPSPRTQNQPVAGTSSQSRQTGYTFDNIFQSGSRRSASLEDLLPPLRFKDPSPPLQFGLDESRRRGVEGASPRSGKRYDDNARSSNLRAAELLPVQDERNGGTDRCWGPTGYTFDNIFQNSSRRADLPEVTQPLNQGGGRIQGRRAEGGVVDAGARGEPGDSQPLPAKRGPRLQSETITPRGSESVMRELAVATLDATRELPDKMIEASRTKEGTASRRKRVKATRQQGNGVSILTWKLSAPSWKVWVRRGLYVLLFAMLALLGLYQRESQELGSRRVRRAHDAIVDVLSQERGRRACRIQAVASHATDPAVSEARRWGWQTDVLLGELARRLPHDLVPVAKELLEEMVWNPQPSGVLLIERDMDGTTYVAHSQTRLTWQCTLKLNAEHVWSHHKYNILFCVVVLFGLVWFQRRRRFAVAEVEQVAQIVRDALARLKEQARIHVHDAATTHPSYLVVVRLRDELLEHELALSERQRLWSRVERVVETNTNVRITLEETPDGEEMIVWRWLGSL